MEENLDVKEQWVETPEGRLFVCLWQPVNTNSKSPIVLFHDSLGCVQLWRDFPGQLAQLTGRGVIAYDRLGFGQSEARSDLSSVDFISEEGNQYFPYVVQALGLKNFILFGHSVGGAMAVITATKFPGQCLAVVTESSQAFVEDRTREGIQAAKISFAQPGQLEKLAKYHGDKAQWALDSWTEVWLSPEFAAWSLQKDLLAVKCPVLAIHGSKDEYGSLAFPEMISSLTGGKMAVLEGVGHVPHREQADIVLKMIAEFVQPLP